MDTLLLYEQLEKKAYGEQEMFFFNQEKQMFSLIGAVT